MEAPRSTCGTLCQAVSPLIVVTGAFENVRLRNHHELSGLLRSRSSDMNMQTPSTAGLTDIPNREVIDDAGL
jgi:hypothetical protein